MLKAIYRLCVIQVCLLFAFIKYFEGKLPPFLFETLGWLGILVIFINLIYVNFDIISAIYMAIVTPIVILFSIISVIYNFLKNFFLMVKSLVQKKGEE